MYILIDNTSDGEVIFLSALDTKLVQDRFVMDKAGGLLASLEQWLRKIGKTKSDIHGLGVVIGKGRFTLTRVAVTMANTLAFAFGAPVVGLSDSNYEVFMDKIKQIPVGQYVSAKYSGEANIGKVKVSAQGGSARLGELKKSKRTEILKLVQDDTQRS